MKRWELSLLIAFAAMLLWSAVSPSLLGNWWGAAFSTLCGRILRAPGNGEVVLRSKLWELILRG